METTFDFEKPIADLQTQIEKVKQVEEKTKVDMGATVRELEIKLRNDQAGGLQHDDRLAKGSDVENVSRSTTDIRLP